MKIFKKVISSFDSEEKDLGNAFKRIEHGNFSGNTGKVVKNSGYRLATIIASKIGSLLFTIILARLLMPELFGFYGLALSTIIFLGAFSELGIFKTILTFLSKTIDKDKGKARSYFFYLGKIKLLSIFVSSIVILLTANWIANVYYQKPIFYALLAGAIYFPLLVGSRFFATLFVSRNNFKVDLIGEILFQISRMMIIPLLVLFLISRNESNALTLFWIFIGLSVCFLLLGIYYTVSFLFDNPFKKVKKQELNKKEKKNLWRFMLPLSITSISGFFFGYIDIIMLGHYVDSKFIGLYYIALSLITSATSILGFSSSAIFPIFSRIKGNQLERGLKKTRNITLKISLIALIITLLISELVIRFIYGAAYLDATIYLRLLSLLLISFPLIELYQAYYISQKQTIRFSSLLIISTILNIILNFILINFGLSWGMEGAVIGACTATIFSRYAYLAMLIGLRKKSF